MAKGRKTANTLMALSSAAVMAVYAAGYTRTRSAADRLDDKFRAARPTIPRPGEIREASFDARAAGSSGGPTVPARPVAPATPAAPEKVEIAKAESVPAPVAAKATAPATETTPAVETAKVPAAAPTPAATPEPAPDPYKAVIAAAAAPWKDGSYSGWGSCRHGDLEVTVTIQDGKITSAPVTNCQTRYSCNIIDKLPPQVVSHQSPDVSYIGGATQSTDAYYWALIVALGKAH